MLFWGDLASLTGSDGKGHSQSQSENGDSKGAKNDQNQGADGKSKTVLQCNRDLLWSYKLKGRDISSLTEKFLLCPDVKHNCCNKIDQQKIYHYVNDVMPARHLEYRTKVQQAITRLEKLHKRIRKAIFNFPGEMARKRWCARQHREVINFQYKPLFEKLQEHIETGWNENLDQYQSFYCVLCDGENHRYFNVKKNPYKVMMDSNFCRTYIDQRQDEIKLLNVELIDYMKMVQNVVDCVHYTKSYNLNFFDESRLEFAARTTECLQSTEGPDFLVKCQPLCQQLSINEVIPMAEGDFVFLNNAVTLFEKFFSYQEKGRFISMKLRLFFKRFEIPKTMTLLREEKFLKKIEKTVKPKLPPKLVKPAPPALDPMGKFWAENPGIDEDSPYDMRFSGGKDDEEEDESGNRRRRGKVNKDGFVEDDAPIKDKWGRVIDNGRDRISSSMPSRALRLSGQRLKRELSMNEDYNPEYESLLMNNISFDHLENSINSEESFVNAEAPIAVDDSPLATPQRVLEEVPLKKVHLGNGRKLQAVNNGNGNGNGNQQNNNGQQQNQSQNNGNGNTNNQQDPNQNNSNTRQFRRKRTARLVFDRDLYRFYDEISVKKPEKSQKTIFRVKKQPLNIARFERVFMDDTGINPAKYQSKRFNLPKALFYKELFTFRIPDKRDPNLLFMLADFNKDYKKFARKALRKDYTINPNNFKFKTLKLASPKELVIPEPPLITWSSLQSKPGPDINAIPGQNDQQGRNDKNGNTQSTNNDNTNAQQTSQPKRVMRKKK